MQPASAPPPTRSSATGGPSDSSITTARPDQNPPPSAHVDSQPNHVAPIPVPTPSSGKNSKKESPPVPAAPDDIRLAVDQLVADPSGTTSAQVLSRLLGNVVKDPSSDKFRKIRLTNPRIQAAVVDVDGGLDLLLACGFQIIFERTTNSNDNNSEDGDDMKKKTCEGGESDEKAERINLHDDVGQNLTEDGFAVLPDSIKDLTPLYAALRLLQNVTHVPHNTLKNQQQSEMVPFRDHHPTSIRVVDGTMTRDRPWAPARERATRVILPKSIDTDVPEWFFQRTGNEVKAALMSAMRRREESQVLMTRAMRERLQASSKVPAVTAATCLVATVKIRLPEGISVQGEFDPGEPVAAVFGWLVDCLADPLQTYDLIMPDRQILTQHAQHGRTQRQLSVREAGLAPSVTLNLRWTGPSAVTMRTTPALRSELLEQP